MYNKRVISLALALSLAAAGLHATWNVLLKTTGDPLRTATRAMGAAVVVTSPVATLAWLLSGRPGLPPQAWLLAGLSGFAELAYLNFLSAAYRCGDLSVVYPLARGTAPLLAVPAGLVLLRERLSPLELGGVACLLVGIWAARRPVAAGPAVRPALLTGVCIATYSTIDRVGVRLAPPWLYGWVLWIDMAVLLAAWLWLGRRQAAVRVAGRPLGAPAVTFAFHRDELGLAADFLQGLLEHHRLLVAHRVAPKREHYRANQRTAEEAIRYCQELVTGIGSWEPMPTRHRLRAGDRVTLPLKANQIFVTTAYLDFLTSSTATIVDIWHANGSGVYSDESSQATLGETYLRGVQFTSKHGHVAFSTIYPGHYSGRTTHIHAKVHISSHEKHNKLVGGHVSHTRQMFPPDAVNATVYQLSPYRGETAAVITHASDSVWSGQHGSESRLKITMAGSRLRKGLIGTIVLGVNPKAVPAAVGGNAGVPTGPSPAA